MKPGPKNLITDIAGLKVGNASDDGLKSGCTVLIADRPFRAGVHVMGGAPGSRETDLLAPDKTVDAVDALVLSGGSAFGLDSCSGVVDGLHSAGRGYVVGPARVPLVPGAIIFDLLNGGDKEWAENPYRSLGKRALDAAEVDFDLGSFGAGTGATTAQHKGGLGSTSYQLDSGYTVGALVAVNSVGSVATPKSHHFWAAAFEEGDEFGGLGASPHCGQATAAPNKKMKAMEGMSIERANTTIAIVATDAPLTKAQCHRLAVGAHDGMARAIVPAHTPFDGDLVFAASVSEAPEPVDDMVLMSLCEAAAHALTRAIARAVFSARPAPNDILPCWNDSR